MHAVGPVSESDELLSEIGNEVQCVRVSESRFEKKCSRLGVLSNLSMIPIKDFRIRRGAWKPDAVASALVHSEQLHFGMHSTLKKSFIVSFILCLEQIWSLSRIRTIACLSQALNMKAN